MKFGLGQGLKRVEDQRLVTGRGAFTDDETPEGCLEAIVHRSTHAHAEFEITNLDSVRAMPGVRLVLTAADVSDFGDVPCLTVLPNSDGSQNHAAHIPLLAKGIVKHVGDAIAFVVADSRSQAETAASSLDVDYSDLPAVADLRKAASGDAAQVWKEQPDNIATELQFGDPEAVDSIFASAPRSSRIEIVNNRLICNYMEPRACIAEYDGSAKSWTLTVTSQGVHGLRDTLASAILNVDSDRLRVITKDVGGAFGTKTFMYREYALAVIASQQLGKPVKWIATRSDHFVSDAQGRDNLSVGEVALDEKGNFLAMRFDILSNMGAYLSQFGPYIAFLCASMVTGVYRTPAISARLRAVYTNTVPVDAYRGAGRPEASYLVERLVDAAARDIGMSPAELRRLNFIQPSAMPYSTPVGDRVYDTGEFDGHMTRALEMAAWDGFETRMEESRQKGKIRGIGLATYVECTAWTDSEESDVRLEEDGTVTVFSGTQAGGQGHQTAYAQFAAQYLDIPLEQIKVIQGDTAQVRTGFGTGGSRSIPIGGIAVDAASKDLAGKLKALAAKALDVPGEGLEISDGAVRQPDTNRFMTFAQIAELPDATVEARTGTGGFTPPDATYPNGTHVAEVEIHPETGVVEIVGYHICDDFGFTVNPVLLAGQVYGGVAQGIGQALHERVVYDESGQLLTGSLMDYCIPRADDMPFVNFETRNVPSSTNPIGVKGAGEAGSIGSCPAVMNAVIDALDRAYGIKQLDMPATPGRVFDAIQSAA